MSDKAWSKFDAGLRKENDRLRRDPNAEVPVMISLEAEVMTSGESIEVKEARFRERASGLIEELKKYGAQDIQEYWINSTLSARVKIGTLDAIGSRSDVKQILLLVRHKAVL